MEHGGVGGVEVAVKLLEDVDLATVYFGNVGLARMLAVVVETVYKNQQPLVVGE